ncbi:MAG TPA: RHS repeat-associated core domain-containing protein [Chthoniobacterales bacterium]
MILNHKKSNMKIFTIYACLMACVSSIWQIHANNDLPGIPVQSEECFFTGKPYDADIGGVIFKYRNYDPEISRWTVVDPSGFPDGVNNQLYTSNPLRKFDPLGLTTIDSFNQAVDYWRRSNGSTQDTATIGSSIIGDIKASGGFSDLVQRIQDNRIRRQINDVDPNDSQGWLPDNPGAGPASIGFVDLVLGRTSISYSDSSSWTAISNWYKNADGVWGRNIRATTNMSITSNEIWDFQAHEGDPGWVNFFEETLPGMLVGAGTPFNLSGQFGFEFEIVGFQTE